MTYAKQPPSLVALVTLLREPGIWPPGFEWSHRHPHKNAVGLAFRHWGGPTCYDDSNEDYVLILAKILQCPEEVCAETLLTHLTFCQQYYKRGLFRGITPEMVAKAIEAKIGQAVKAPHPLLAPAIA